MQNDFDARLQLAAQTVGFPLDEDIRIGGNYVSVMQHGELLYLSGQVPRIGTEVKVTGRVGDAVSLQQAQYGAQICALRALCLIRLHLGSLASVQQILHVGVYTQCTDSFTQQSEVADAASKLLHDVMGDAGRHARTSVGVYQLPKNASVELNMTLALRPASA
jgi:enamine deaminase RidA (YjgF/YER057c/UK114 family)